MTCNDVPHNSHAPYPMGLYPRSDDVSVCSCDINFEKTNACALTTANACTPAMWFLLDTAHDHLKRCTAQLKGATISPSHWPPPPATKTQPD